MNNGAEKLSMAEILSALADGEGEGLSAAAVTALWRDDAQLRARWHGYQLIGDAMRSDELAGRGHDADFLKRLRVRLDDEPVVLAPQRPVELAAVQTLAPTSRARRWATPVAMAAGFVMVAGAVLVTRAPQPLVQQQLAAQDAPPAAVVNAAGAASGVAPSAVPLPGVLLRDPRMQQYFEAHQQFGGSTALGLSSSFLRNATFETPVESAGSR